MSAGTSYAAPQILLGEYAENEFRKDFTKSERVAIATAVERELGERRGGSNPEKFPDCKGKETREIAAERAGFGNERTYQQAAKVVELGAPELVDAMDKDEISISARRSKSAIADMKPERTDKELVKNIAQVEPAIHSERTGGDREGARSTIPETAKDNGATYPQMRGSLRARQSISQRSGRALRSWQSIARNP